MEPLKELALFSYYWAPLLCKSPKCTAYHQHWSLIRLLDGAGRQPDHANFFIDGLNTYADKSNIKILISGCADTGILAIVNDAMIKMEFIPKITLIDQCATTIQQNRLYADYLNLDVELIVGDILTANLSDYDVILAHSFLNFFDDRSLEILFKQWHSFLNIDGVLLINNKSVSEPTNNINRKINLSLINERMINVEKEIKKLGLQKELATSIKDFWLTGDVRDLITTSRLMELVKINKFAVLSHELINNKKGSAPTSVRYVDYSRHENLLILQKENVS